MCLLLLRIYIYKRKTVFSKQEVRFKTENSSEVNPSEGLVPVRNSIPQITEKSDGLQFRFKFTFKRN